MRKGAFFRVLARPNFAKFAIAQTISQFGDRLNNIALLALVGAEAAHSPFAYSQVAAFAALPVIIFGPIAGVLADRLNRKWLMAGVDLARAIIVFSMPTLFFLTKNLLLVNFAVFLIFLLGLLFNSSKMAILPGLVAGKEEYVTANSLANFIGRFATFLGLYFGGILVELAFWKKLGWTGWQAGFYMDATTYLISAIFLSLLSLPKDVVRPRAKPVRLIEEEAGAFRKAWRDLKEALVLVRRRRLIRAVYEAVFILVFFLGSAYSLDIILTQQVFGYGAKGIGVLGGFLGIGLIIGAFVMGHVNLKGRGFQVLLGSLGGLGVLTAVSAFVSWFKLFAALTVLAGALLSAAIITVDTLFHRMVPSSFRGRIFSAREITWGAGFILTTLLMGGLAELLKLFMPYHSAVQLLLVVNGSLILLASVALDLSLRNKCKCH